MTAGFTNNTPNEEPSKILPRISGSEAVIRSFLAEGVDTIFGYPGGAIIPVYDALYDYRDKINHILVRHEQCALHAAMRSANSASLMRRLIERDVMSMSIMSPLRTMPISPPEAASGDTWPIDRPEVPPEKRPSVIKAQALSRCFDLR